MKSLSTYVLFLLLALASGLGTVSTGAQEPELKALKTDPFCVVQVDDEVKVIRKSELANLRRDLDGKYREAVKEYSRARLTARKSKEAFTAPRPSKPRLKTIAASVKTEEEAIQLRDKVLNDYVVVKVGDRFEVVRQVELLAFKAKLESDYRQAMTKHDAAKKSARKSRQPFTERAPARPKLKVVASRLKSEEEAVARMRQLEGNDRKTGDRKTKSRKTNEKKEKNEEDENVEEDDENEADSGL